jgi:hypothetical protein
MTSDLTSFIYRTLPFPYITYPSVPCTASVCTRGIMLGSLLLFYLLACRSFITSKHEISHGLAMSAFGTSNGEIDDMTI